MSATYTTTVITICYKIFIYINRLFNNIIYIIIRFGKFPLLLKLQQISVLHGVCCTTVQQTHLYFGPQHAISLILHAVACDINDTARYGVQYKWCCTPQRAESSLTVHRKHQTAILTNDIIINYFCYYCLAHNINADSYNAWYMDLDHSKLKHHCAK